MRKKKKSKIVTAVWPTLNADNWVRLGRIPGSINDTPIIYCSACGNEAGRGLVAKHVCVYQPTQFLIERQIICVTLNFCGPECECLWVLKNAEFLHEGLHGQGFDMKNIEKQIALFTVPANRPNPYGPYGKYSNLPLPEPDKQTLITVTTTTEPDY